MVIGHSMTDKKIIRNVINKNGAKVYFIGIGGVSMSALALMLKERGLKIYGSDINKSSYTEMLERFGIIVNYSHGRAKIMSVMPDLVVYSLSISEENAEYIAAKKLGIPTVSRAELLGAVMCDYEIPIGVSGSHGKSTVTALMAGVLNSQKIEPTVLCGADISAFGGYIHGKKKYLVYEACEYGDSFLKFNPKIQIILNLDLDHTDYFDSEEKIRESFLRAANLSEITIMCTDSRNLNLIKDRVKSRLYTFSKSDESDYRYEIKGSDKGRFSFDLYLGKDYIDSFSLGVMGEFNVPNAVSTVIAAEILGVPRVKVKAALTEFRGLPRRLEIIKKAEFGDVFYDYAHHPCEISAVREALYSAGYKRICAVFAPHTYSRTKAFLSDFARELSKFSKVYVTDIYGAREAPVPGITSLALSEKIKTEGAESSPVSDDDVLNFLKKEKYDAIVLMGAGRLEKIKKYIIEC